MTYVTAELEQTTIEIEINSDEIVQDASSDIEEIMDDVLDTKDYMSRDEIEDMLNVAVAKVSKRFGIKM